MPNEPLSQDELAQIWELIWAKLQENGVDYKPELIAPTTPEDWARIKILVKDERDLAHVAECNIDLKSAFDAYGIDVRLVAETVEQAELRINTAKTEAVNAETYVKEKVIHIDEVAGNVENAKTEAVNSASSAATSARNAGTSETNASDSASAAARDAEVVGAVLTEAQSVAQQTAIDKADIADMKSAVERIYQDASEGGIYGVDFNMVTGAATRIDAAVGLEFRKYVGGAGSAPLPTGKSFMQIGPWAQIYQTLRTVDGNSLVARTGDANFEAMLRSGTCNLFTCIPRYWIKMETPIINGQDHWIIHVSAKPFAGAFSVIEGDSVEIASIVTGKKDGKHVSQPGVVPLVNTNAYTFENTAEQQGLYNSSWNDFLAWWILMLVQTANLNSQRAVGYGVSSGMPFSWGDANTSQIKEASAGATNTVVVKRQNFKKGLLIYIGTNYYNGSLGVRHVVSYKDHAGNSEWMDVTFDGDPIETTTAHWCTALAQDVSVDAVLGMGLNCGWYKDNEELSEGQCHAFVYGICDPWSNIFQATSGMCKKADKLYVASGRQKQPSDVPCANWVEADDFAWLGEGWPRSWRIQQSANTIIMVPTALGGNDGTLFGDYLWGAADSIRIPWRAGSFNRGGYDGACYVRWPTAGYSSVDYGARLTYQKKK